MKPIRVLVVDDSGTARALIRALLESEPGLSVARHPMGARHWS